MYDTSASQAPYPRTPFPFSSQQKIGMGIPCPGPTDAAWVTEVKRSCDQTLQAITSLEVEVKAIRNHVDRLKFNNVVAQGQ